jgi:hypothetical protein
MIIINTSYALFDTAKIKLLLLNSQLNLTVERKCTHFVAKEEEGELALPAKSQSLSLCNSCHPIHPQCIEPDGNRKA